MTQEQAFDRAHRYGQTRDVNIFKLTIEETVEDRILMVHLSYTMFDYLTPNTILASREEARVNKGCLERR